MRIVLDTNVVVSALLWGGTHFKLFQAATSGTITLYTSPALLAELSDVLARKHLADRLFKQRSSLDQALRLYEKLTISVSPPDVPRVVPNDADDDQVIAAAIVAQAHIITTGDTDLLILHPFRDIKILTAADTLALCNQAE
jgi:putative PIN family toxin of toxin-antitoxin system